MTRSRKRIFILIAVFLVLAVIGGSVAVLVSKLYQLDIYKTTIIAEMRKSLNRDVRYDKGGFSLSHGPGFTFSKIAIKQKDNRQADDLITADRISFRLALLPLLFKKIVIKEMVLERPSVRL